MRSSKELTDTFFSELKRYNSTNFKNIEKADLSVYSAETHKAFSAVITRYFIFSENHEEITEEESKILYFKLKLDLVAKYFSEYPETSTDNLIAFQIELRNYVKEHKEMLAMMEKQKETGEKNRSRRPVPRRSP